QTITIAQAKPTETPPGAAGGPRDPAQADRLAENGAASPGAPPRPKPVGHPQTSGLPVGEGLTEQPAPAAPLHLRNEPASPPRRRSSDLADETAMVELDRGRRARRTVGMLAGLMLVAVVAGWAGVMLARKGPQRA